jgi:hypothetical protein
MFYGVLLEVAVNYVKDVGSEGAHQSAHTSKKFRHGLDLQPISAKARSHEIVVRSFNMRSAAKDCTIEAGGESYVELIIT